MNISRFLFLRMHKRSEAIDGPDSLSLIWLKRMGLCLTLGLFTTSVLLVLLAACSSPFSSSAPTPTATPSHLILTRLHWCGKPSMVFRDEGAVSAVTPGATATAAATSTPAANATPGSTPTPVPSGPRTITEWTEVKSNLGFQVYLPAMLPNGACLVSAQATIHDSIFGGSFTIGYLLPDHSSISLSEAPLTSQSTTFQCSAATPTPGGSTRGGTPGATATAGTTQPGNQLCSGARDTTNIVLSERGTTDQAQQFFNALQPNIDWIPAS